MNKHSAFPSALLSQKDLGEPGVVKSHLGSVPLPESPQCIPKTRNREFSPSLRTSQFQKFTSLSCHPPREGKSGRIIPLRTKLNLVCPRESRLNVRILGVPILKRLETRVPGFRGTNMQGASKSMDTKHELWYEGHGKSWEHQTPLEGLACT